MDDCVMPARHGLGLADRDQRDKTTGARSSGKRERAPVHSGAKVREMLWLENPSRSPSQEELHEESSFQSPLQYTCFWEP